LTFILQRSVQLFLIGVVLNSVWGSPLEQLRIFGVLQRFGVAYLVVSTVYILLWRDGSILPQNPLQRACYDLLLIGPQWCVILLLTLGYLLIIYFLPVPGCQR
jgi:heparan-alpha-glucosaminide N-acetyltransferase